MQNIINEGDFIVGEIVKVYMNCVVIKYDEKIVKCFLYKIRHINFEKLVLLQQIIRKNGSKYIFYCRKNRKCPIVELWPHEDIDKYEDFMIFICNNKPILIDLYQQKKYIF